MTTVKQALESAIEAMELYQVDIDRTFIDEAINQCKSALAELESVEPVAYCDVLNALVGMCFQYLTMPDGKLDHSFMSAGEDALEVLEKLGLITGEFGEIIPEALDEGWIKNKFINKPQTREWVGLSEKELFSVQYDLQYSADGFTPMEFARAIEAKLRELNTKG